MRKQNVILTLAVVAMATLIGTNNATAAVINVNIGQHTEVGSRLNDAILDKVARNAGSSWSQSGHLQGRVRKIRLRVDPTVGPAATPGDGSTRP